MHKITDQIWIGSSQDAKNLEAIQAAEINCILNCAEDLVPALGWHHGITHFHVGLRDDTNHPSRYRAAVHCLKAAKEEGKKILVHCHEGRSRSVFVVALLLCDDAMRNDVDWAIDYIRARRPIAEVHRGHRISMNL